MRYRRVDPWLLVGLVLCGALFLIALYGERLVANDPFYLLPQGPNGEERPFPPGFVFPLGSDNAGRDLLSVVILGARTTLAVVALAGVARLALGLLLALLGARLRIASAPLDLLAEVAGSLPATVAALLVVVAFFAQNTPLLAPVVALAVVGWAGPYRLIRAELRRLAQATFTEGARVIGAGRWRILLRHHLPHLVPLLALATAQQIAASLVAVAELGVLGAFVGAVRGVDVIESLNVVRRTDATTATIQDIPEWGGMLALSRGLGNVYFTRWVILTPAVAIAFAAVSVSLLGIGIARQYARRDLFRDVSARRALAAVALVAIVVAPAQLLPPRDADAVAFASYVRSLVPAADVDADTFAQAVADAGLRPLGGGFVLEHRSALVEQSGLAHVSMTVGGATRDLAQGWGRDADFMPVLYGQSGGGLVDAPVVFVGFGIAPADYPKLPHSPFMAPPFSDFAGDLPDDYAKVDVNGKVAMFLRVERYARGRFWVSGADLETQIASALARGANAVLVVDAAKSLFENTARGRPNPYRSLSDLLPIQKPHGPPVLVIEPRVADTLLQGTGIVASEILTRTAAGPSGAVPFDDLLVRRSQARELDARMRIDLPVELVAHASRTIVAATGANVRDGAMLVWATAPSRVDSDAAASRALLALTRALRGYQDVPLILVLFDPSGDTNAAAAQVAEKLRGIPLHLIVALDTLRGSQLQFLTRYGVLQPPFDHYGDRVGAPHAMSGGDAEPGWPTGVLFAFPKTHYVLIRGQGAGSEVVGDAAAVVGYAVERFRERAPELLR